MHIWIHGSGLTEIQMGMDTDVTAGALAAERWQVRSERVGDKRRLPRAVDAVRTVTQTRGGGFGLIVLLVVITLAILAPWVAPYGPTAVDSKAVLESPSLSHPFGTDELGRDTLSRIIWGSRVSLQVGIISVGLALLLGVPTGLLAGFLGGWVDDLVMRTIDAVWSFPTMVLALAIGTAFGAGLTSSFIAVGVVFAPTITRLVRAQTLSVRELDYVLAARALGATPTRIMRAHIWPNVTSPVVVQTSILVAAAIILEAGLSFLGVGVQPPTPAWGSMLRTGYPFLLTTPWPSVFPGMAIFITVLGFNLLGDALQRALDPQLRQSSTTSTVEV